MSTSFVMYTVSFRNRQFPEDLEVKTQDDQILYVSKSWLCFHSEYFKALLTNGCAESYDKQIKLSHNCIVLEIVFGWLCYAYRGEESVNLLLSKIDTNDLLYDFFSALEEYNLISCKKYAEKFYATENMTRILLKTKCDHSLIEIVVTFKLDLMKELYNSYLNTEQKWFNCSAKNCNLKEINEFTSHWDPFLNFFSEWLIDRDPTDDDLQSIINLKFEVLSVKNVEKLIRIIRKFTKADKFKQIVFDKISYVLYPEK